MSVSIEKKARNLQDAIKEALEELGVSEDDVLIEVLDEGDEGGILGIGRRQAHVRITVDEVDEDDNAEDYDEDEEYYGDDEFYDEIASNDEEAIVLEFVSKLFDGIGVEGNFSLHTDGDTVYINVTGKDVGAAIGRHGETLDAIQYLTNLVLNRRVDDRKRVMVDISGYRKRRNESLASLAVRTANKVIRVGKSYEMEPMNPAERRIIHYTLQDFEGVTTFSEGKDPDRCVVISPVKE